MGGGEISEIEAPGHAPPAPSQRAVCNGGTERPSPNIARQITATSHYRHTNMAQQTCSDILEQAVCSKLPDGRRPPVQALH